MQTIAEFVQRLHDDPELLARVEAAKPGERRALLEAAGIEVTPELEEQGKTLAERLGIDPADADSWAGLELSEDELAALAGGGIIVATAAWTAASAGLTALSGVTIAAVVAP